MDYTAHKVSRSLICHPHRSLEAAQFEQMHQALEHQKNIQLQLVQRLRDAMAHSPAPRDASPSGTLQTPSTPPHSELEYSDVTAAATRSDVTHSRNVSGSVLSGVRNLHIYNSEYAFPPAVAPPLYFSHAMDITRLPNVPISDYPYPANPSYQPYMYRDRTVSEPYSFVPMHRERTFTSGSVYSHDGSSLQSDVTYRYDNYKDRHQDTQFQDRRRSFSEDTLRARAIPVPSPKSSASSTSSPPKSPRKEGRTYTCNICNNVFSCSGGLSRHKRIHANRRSYSCSVPECTRSFNRVDNCKTHEAAHRKRLGMDPSPTPIITTKQPIRSIHPIDEEEVLETESGILDF